MMLNRDHTTRILVIFHIRGECTIDENFRRVAELNG